jgi:hypothetical protein
MKTFHKTIPVLLAIAVMSTPLVTFATSQSKSDASFCSQIDMRTGQATQKLDEKIQNFQTKKSTRFAQIATRRAEHDEARVTKQSASDTRHDTRYDALMAKATTDAQRAAVVTFQTKTTQAIEVRRAAIDKAVKEYRLGVDALINGKFGTLDTAVTTLKSSIASAVAEAKSACTTGTDPATVAMTFKSRVKAAHDAFKANRSDAAIKAQIETLISTRKSAVAAAVSTFKTTMEAAKTELKTAFGQ